MSGGEAPQVPQRVRKGSGGATGDVVTSRLAELRLEVSRTPAKTVPRPDGLRYPLEQNGDQALFLQRLHV